MRCAKEGGEVIEEQGLCQFIVSGTTPHSPAESSTILYVCSPRAAPYGLYAGTGWPYLRHS